MMNAPLVFDPADPQTRRSPFALYTRLQDEDPVHWSEALRMWVFTRYDDVRNAGLRPEMSPNRLQPFYEALQGERRELMSEVMRYLNLWLVFRDPPEHTRLRRLLGSVFTPAAIQAMRPSIEQCVEDILARLDPSQPVDFAREVAMLLPAWVILDMLGVPREDFDRIKGWSDDLRLFIGTARGRPDKYRRAREGSDHMVAYFRELISRRRAVPGDDFVSRMVAARDEGDALSEDELIATCILVLFGGHETTTSLLGNAINALLDHPDQLERLRADPALIDSAVEEFLRYDGPSNSMARVVAVDHELEGKTLRKGDRVFAMIGAANRDPRRFEQPQSLDLGRSPNRHLAFGQGIHFCLGAPLARLEARVCLGLVTQRFPKLRRATGEVDWLDAMIMRGVSTLPVHLS